VEAIAFGPIQMKTKRIVFSLFERNVMDYAKRALGCFAFVTFLVISVVHPVAAAPGPVGRLLEPDGHIEYSRDGDRWKRITRTKYVFAGYKIRTGADGRGTFVNQKSGLSRTIGPASSVEVLAEGLAFVKGVKTDPFSNEATLYDGIANKFAKAQRYTMLRRPAIKCSDEVKAARSLALSATHPDLVWNIACPGTTYRLTIDDKVVELVGPEEGNMVRYTVSGVSEGAHTFKVETIRAGQVVYSPRRASRFDWLSPVQEIEIENDLAVYDSDLFAQAGILESEGLLVAVMDTYRGYFSEEFDDNDMRPLLVRSYSRLGLTELQKKEAKIFRDFPVSASP